MEVPMATLSPDAQPDKTDLDEAVAWLRILWKVPVSNADITGFFDWSRRKPAARALYDTLSQRLLDAMLAEPPTTPPPLDPHS
ncbi:hypothetical protein ASC70_19595 [Caulobacter sp. Root343]|nr:hypothetical protein ASC62_23075 [Caulobacter sp. Root342]KQV64036.1 hypothetical protein ASC70_19595 [Caulobacter sp. Root343]